MNILAVFKNYLSGFHDISHFRNNNNTTNIVAALKILSYLSLIPLSFAAVSFYGRIKHVKLSDTIRRIFNIAATQGVTTPKASYAWAGKDKTYNHGTPESNCDFAYANAQHGFGFILDGSGHNDIDMAKALNPLYETFCKYTPSNAKTLAEHKAAFVKQVSSFATAVYQNETLNKLGRGYPSTCPAAVFAQIVEVDAERLLLYVQCADSSILIQRRNGEVIGSRTTDDYGLGDKTKTIESLLQAIPLQPYDRVIGISDGIGEFLTLEQCKEILNGYKQNEGASLLDAFKNAVIASKNESNEKGVTGRTVKIHDASPQKRSNHDDISLFVLTCRE